MKTRKKDKKMPLKLKVLLQETWAKAGRSTRAKISVICDLILLHVKEFPLMFYWTLSPTFGYPREIFWF
jgi:hypothetical protein